MDMYLKYQNNNIMQLINGQFLLVGKVLNKFKKSTNMLL